jgi:hypothetical protein
MRAALLVVIAIAQLPYARQALDLGHTRDDALFESFNRSYDLPVTDPLDHAEIVTEFRRAVLIIRDRANQGEYGTSERDLAKAMAPFEGQVSLIVAVRLHPLHTYARPPSYDIYVETGRSTRPIAAKPFRRDPIYPPGLGAGSSMTGVRLEGQFPRAGIETAAAPMLVVTDDQANVLSKLRIDLSRYR